MDKTKMVTSTEIAKELGVSQSFAYKAIKKMNNELSAQGYFVVAGKVSRTYFEEKFYGIKEAT